MELLLKGNSIFRLSLKTQQIENNLLRFFVE